MPLITDYVHVPQPSLFKWKNPWRQQHFVLTGGPSVGKTAIIECLRQKGKAVIDEAVTYNIRKALAKGLPPPWEAPDFSDNIVHRQRKWQQKALKMNATTVVFDRCPIDALAYDIRDGKVPSSNVVRAVQEILDNGFYEKTVFLIKNLGTYTQAETRHESLEESLEIEAHIANCYRALGFNLVYIPTCQSGNSAESQSQENIRSSVEQRTAMVWKHIQEQAAPSWERLWVRICNFAAACFTARRETVPVF